MPRYRFDLGSWEELDPEEDEEIRRKLEEAGGRIHGLTNSVVGISSLVYKTDDLEDAKEVFREAKKITQEIFVKTLKFMWWNSTLTGSQSFRNAVNLGGLLLFIVLAAVLN